MIISHEKDDSLTACNQVWISPWHPDKRKEKRYEVILKYMCQWARPHPEAPSDDLLLVLLEHVIIFSSDELRRGQLQESGAIADLQAKYLRMLYRYLKYKYGPEKESEARRRLIMAIEVISLAEEANVIKAGSSVYNA